MTVGLLAGVSLMVGGLSGVAGAEEFAPAPRAMAPGEAPSANPATALSPAVLNAYAVGSIPATWMDQGPAPTTNGQVQNLSPNNEVAGAIHAVVTHPTNPNILYIGAVNGGVWHTTNATMASPIWTPLTDFEPSLSIGALEMDAGNPMILLAGIGRFSSFGGDPPFQVAGGPLSGLLRTTDGGSTWTPITDPLLVGEHISSVASRGSILLAGANNFFGGGGIGGLFRSTDTGATWTQITGGLGTGLPVGTVDDLAGDPGSTSRLYVALEGNGIYRTDDTGAMWTQVSNNDVTLNAAMLGSTNTRIAVGNGSRVFVLVTSGGTVTYIGFSDDQGLTWTQMDVPGTVETPLRGRDELMGLVVDPNDSDIVYVSAVSQLGTGPMSNIFPNSVGATSFHAHMFRGDVTRARGVVNNVSSQWDHLTHQAGAGGMPNGGTANTSSPHADSRAMTFDANGNLIEVDDGGITRRTNPGNNAGDWFSINGDIQVAEIHSIAYDSNFDILIGGTQDTGTPEQSAPGSTTWNTLSAADGGKVAVDDSVPGTSVRYFSFQNLLSFTRRTCNPACVNVLAPLAGRNPAQFYTPLELNTVNPTRLLLGTVGGLSESLDQGNTASIVPGAAVTANSDAAMVYGHPNNAELIYVGAGAQVFLRTTAGGNLAATAGAFPGGTVYGVAVDPADEDIVYAIGNASVFQSVDGGANWTNITGNITADGAGTFRAIAYIAGPLGEGLAVGTNQGVLVSEVDQLGTWFKLGTNLPNAPVWDLDYESTDDVLAAGTLGRGAWIVEDVSKLPCILTCPANITQSNDLNQCGAVVTYAPPSTAGFCGTVTCSPPSGSFFPKGTTTVTCTSASGTNCSFTVTVNDTQPPNIQCPADITVCNDPGLCSAVVSFTVTATDNCSVQSVVCNPLSGSVFAKGTIPVTCTATDTSGNTAMCSFNVTVNDCEPPNVTCSIANSSLWPPNHTLLNVGLTVTATDNCPGPLTTSVQVFSDEDDETPTGDGRFSPDAKDIAPGTLRLRKERKGDADGRVYLVVTSATDTSGNRGFACCTVVVAHDQSKASVASVNAQAAAARAFCDAHNDAPPAGFVVVGDGPIIGPKQ